MSFWTRQDRVAAKDDALRELRDVAEDGKVSKQELKGAGRRLLGKILFGWLEKKAKL